MAHILFYDTETSGIPLALDHADSAQPYCLQIGVALYDEERDKIMQQASMMLDWGQIDIHPKAQVVHGIDVQTLMASGVNSLYPLQYFHAMARRAETAIGFNVGFDRKIVSIAMHKIDGPAQDILNMPHYDLMLPLTPVCKIPGKRGGHKWPKLTEAYCKLIDANGFEGAHDAFADIAATIELWKWCKANGVQPVRV